MADSVTKVCAGMRLGANCHHHEDCSSGMYCKKSTEAPFKSTCDDYLEESEQCTEDEQCANDYFCWYLSAEDKAAGVRKCIETYSQDSGVQFGYMQSEG